MNRSTQIWVGVLVLAGLGGAVVYKAREDQKIGSSSTTSADVPEIKADEVDKIRVVNGEKPEIVIEKKGDKWEVVKPVQAPANQANVKSVVDSLKELKTKEVIESNPSDDTKKDYHFDPAKAVVVQAWKGDAKKLDAKFGKSGGRGQVVMVDGKPGIYTVSGYQSYLFTREVKGWRDTDIFKFDDANVSQVTIDGKSGHLSFTKGGDKWAGTLKDKPIERFDEDKVKDALRAFKSLTAEDFGDGKTVADTGLDAPEGKIAIQLKDGAGKYVLSVGKTSTGTSRFAQKEGEPTIYTVSQYASDWALGDVAKFQRAGDAGAPDGGKKDALGMPPGMPGMPGMPHGMPPGMGDDPHGH